ncbi:MAG: glycosyltransferase, partial [Proteobacteria bacterium]
MLKLGIGIVTYNRLERLQQVVAAVKAHTTSPFELVVAEDGGDDGTREWCAQEGVRIVSGQNAGVCWNKNRALFALQAMGCDPILLLEDDCFPVETGWDQDWRIATALYGHVSFAHDKLAPWKISGSGRATDPVVNYKSTAQCSSVSGLALAE